MSDRLQQQRYELKYQIEEAKALQIRTFVQAHLAMDEYSARSPIFSYPTLSLYLDGGSLDYYWDTINGNKNRFKLRLRYYDDRPNSPVFFEIKRREDNVILKARCGVRKDAIHALLGGQLPEREHMLDPADAEGFGALQKFCQFMSKTEAHPTLHVAYLREAYENPTNNAVRVTFDRRVESAPQKHSRLVERTFHAHPVFGKTVILELKFTARFPNWFRDLVETFDCVQEGAAKYAFGIYEKGETWVLKPNSRERLIDEFLSASTYPCLFDNNAKPLH